jgi:photosynthetic reaction center cytochrome c subunit
VGAERCRFCHPTEVEGYARSAMAHALRQAGKEPDGVVSANGSKITMHSSPTGFWQTWENAGEKSDYRVDYVIGSGEHASGYLVDIGGHLFQSPVAYYKTRASYDLAPGYEKQPDPDFTRPVSEECVLCHSGVALHVRGTLNQYRSPAFPEEGISCERCHGPAEKHLEDPRAGTIINPEKLDSKARDSICEQCHLFGVARVANPGKEIGDFIPGRPLEETFTIYRNVVPPGSPAGDFKVISHVEQLALSACARNSAGRLWCGTCHNPHEKLAQSVQYYRSRCLSCHTAQLPAAHPAKDSNCLECHMPRRNAKDGGHTVFTDHRIQRVPETPQELPANSGIAAWREPSADLQERNLGIAYIDVGMQRHLASFVIQGYRMLTAVQEQFANDSGIFKSIGEALLLGKQTAEAKVAFQRALQLEPSSALTEASAASPYIEEGNAAEAIAHLERAINLDPLLLPAASTLIGLYEKQGKFTEANALSTRIKRAMDEQSGSSPTDSAANAGRHAEEVYKNIQVLKEVPAEQLIPAMQFITSSLGVECGFCHVEGHFDKDDKKPKQAAREMMKMMFAINGNNFGSDREVTCYSCHRGTPQPIGTPILGSVQPTASATETAQNLPKNLPSADWLVKKYIEALGGAEVLENITSRVGTGSATVSGHKVKMELLVQSPGKWAVIQHGEEGDSAEVFDGRTGWFTFPGRLPRDMHRPEIEAAQMDADLQFPLHIQQVFPELRAEYPENVGDRESYVLLGIRENQPGAKFYFDEETGLLARLVRYGESPLGVNSSQIDYADYREVNGVQVPFRVTVSNPKGNLTMQFEQIRQNVAIDPERFARPSADHASTSAAPALKPGQVPKQP